MSVVLVCFPGAPTVTEEAQQRDKEINALVEKKVEGMDGLSLQFNFTQN